MSLTKNTKHTILHTKGGFQRFFFLGDPRRNERNKDVKKRRKRMKYVMKGSIIQDTKYQDNNFCISCHEGFQYTRYEVPRQQILYFCLRWESGGEKGQRRRQGEKRSMKHDVWAALIIETGAERPERAGISIFVLFLRFRQQQWFAPCLYCYHIQCVLVFHYMPVSVV